jgi:hypothetical protein
MRTMTTVELEQAAWISGNAVAAEQLATIDALERRCARYEAALEAIADGAQEKWARGAAQEALDLEDGLEG